MISDTLSEAVDSIDHYLSMKDKDGQPWYHGKIVEVIRELRDQARAIQGLFDSGPYGCSKPADAELSAYLQTTLSAGEYAAWTALQARLFPNAVAAVSEVSAITG